ncbi:centrosomal protein of 55 kDa isoform X2 [Ambystoma mexicanum]|uniref:centrosomal protein of 55 kDa isoform X2 n=1 Tax=Ambystoma mexicanum TaxID=8296 RepID=UPI0037E844DC
MTAKTAKDLITNKLGFKAVVSKSDTDLEKLKKENSALKKAVEEISKGKGKLTDMERSQLLEKILALETEKEKHNQQLSEKNQEILHLKDKLRAKYHGDASHGQLAAKAKEAERREQLYKSLSEETDSLKKQLYTVTAKCVELENKAIACQISQESGTSQLVHLKDQNPVESQLKDALEKNQQWLVYDQQREVYVKGLVSRIYDLEQQLGTMNQTVQQKAKDGHLEGPQEEEKQKYYDRLLITAKNDLDAEKKRSAQLGFDHTELKKKYDEKKKEMMDVSNTLLSQIAEEQQQRENEKRRMGDKIQKLKTEVELTKQKYEDEKKRSDDLSSRVDLLQNTVLKHQEENRRISFLEQQIHLCTTELENEKLDNQNAQHQIYKVRKELRKAKEQMRLQPAKQMHEFHYTESSNDFHTEFDDRLKICNQNQSPKRSSLLNESFLECPKCKAQYPTSQHRELLTHIDFCPDI